MCPAAVYSVTLNIAWVQLLMHDVSTCASIFSNLYMIRCRQHQHIRGERTFILKHQ